MKRKFFLMALTALYLAGAILCLYYGFIRPIQPETRGESSPMSVVMEDNNTSVQTADAKDKDTSSDTGDSGDNSASEPMEPEIPDTEEAVASTEGESPQYTYTAVHHKGNLHVRSGPGMQYSIIERMKPGDMGDVIALGDQWIQLIYKDTEGYTWKDYLELTEKPAATETQNSDTDAASDTDQTTDTDTDQGADTDKATDADKTTAADTDQGTDTSTDTDTISNSN